MLRCYNSRTSYYRLWGGRGISVCIPWHRPAQFIGWALSNGYAPELSLDRINNDGNYEPDNCHFVTHKRQMRNLSTTTMLTIADVTKPLQDWADENNIKASTLRARVMDYGWPQASWFAPKWTVVNKKRKGVHT
jgi:hypothetical protein